MAKLNKVERFLLENEGPNYKSFRCPVHGVYQIPKGKATSGCCNWAGCGTQSEVIENAAEYAKSH